jgi:excisionase family DNA binding protein
MLDINLNTRLLTMTEAAHLLHVHENTLRRWCDNRVIPVLRIGPRGDRRLVESDVYSLKVRLAQN